MLSDPASLARVLTNQAISAQLPSQLIDALRGALGNSLHDVFIIGLILSLFALAMSVFIRGSASDENEKPDGKKESC